MPVFDVPREKREKKKLSAVVLGVQMGMSLMRGGVRRNCHNMQRQLAVLKA